METYLKLLDIYQSENVQIRTGLSPWHFDKNLPFVASELHIRLPFTTMFVNNDKLNVGGGLHPLEILFLEGLSKVVKPKRIFIIGNSFGWSTIAFALANPKAKVIAIDDFSEGEEAHIGFQYTKRIIEKEKLNAKVIKGHSPEDVVPVTTEWLDGSADMILIDGLHTNEQQNLDFEAVQSICHENTVILLHDVMTFAMTPSWNELRKKHTQYHTKMLMRTPSGMAIFYPKDTKKEITRVIDAFAEEPETLRYTLDEVKKVTKRVIRNTTTSEKFR